MSEMRRVYVALIDEDKPRLFESTVHQMAVSHYVKSGWSESEAEAWRKFGERQDERFKALIAEANQCRQWMGIAAQQIQQEQ